MTWYAAAGDMAAEVFGAQSAKKAAKRQQQYTRENMAYAAQLQRKQDTWKRDVLLRGKLTPWELAGTPPASAGSPLPGPDMVGAASSRHGANTGLFSALSGQANQEQIADKDRKSSILAQAAASGQTSHRELRDLESTYNSFVDGKMGVMGVKDPSPKRALAEVAVAQQALNEATFEWDKYGRPPRRS